MAMNPDDRWSDFRWDSHPSVLCSCFRWTRGCGSTTRGPTRQIH